MRILLLNQCFYPDHVSTAQHLADLALALAEAGHEVTAVASIRGYDNPETRYPVHETWRGITIHRIWTPGLGKRSKWRRFADFACFWVSATFILLRLPRFDVTVCLTSPPLISCLGTAMATVKGGAVIPWVMDLNPDEAVAAGWLRKGSFVEKILSGLQSWSFKRACHIMVLDRFMEKRLIDKGLPQELLHVDAPWAHENTVCYDAALGESFRREHGLVGKFVLMYAGNHSPCHPLKTILEAAAELAGNDKIRFVFMGGGSEFPKVATFAVNRGLHNIICLPYRSLEELSAPLSAANIHLVSMGNAFPGIVHPCKIYNILLLGMPFLSVCPDECHLTDLAAKVNDKRYATCHRHGNVIELVETIKAAAQAEPLAPSPLVQKIGSAFLSGILLPRFVKTVESACRID